MLARLDGLSSSEQCSAEGNAIRCQNLMLHSMRTMLQSMRSITIGREQAHLRVGAPALTGLDGAKFDGATLRHGESRILLVSSVGLGHYILSCAGWPRRRRCWTSDTHKTMKHADFCALQRLLRCDRHHRLVGDRGIAAREGRPEGSQAQSASKALVAAAARDARSGQITTPGARPK
ncbi:hypothetical protein C8R45DRAFT_1030974 [Mycena sanguinolenta]|nr:hypothetical protein C8R45DRAFT_1030974 [Mycena sanguinolenta]